MSAPAHGGASRAGLVAAFAAVYVLWGSTYVAIKFAVETLPPFTMASARFVAAGALLLLWVRWRGGQAATARQWKNAALTGAFLMLASNGLVCWAEQRVDSSLAALLIATLPLWMMTLEWARPGGRRPRALTIAGVAIGILGVALLIWPGEGGMRLDPWGVVALLAAPLSWAIGSFLSREVDLPRSLIHSAALQMICGGVMQFVLGLLLGELASFEPERVSAKSLWSLLYLLVAGSLIGFTAYTWLLRHTSPVRAATYAYVNPIVAVILGVWLAGERFTLSQLAGAAVVVLGVALSLTASADAATPRATLPPPPDPPHAPAEGVPRA
jgi:drug/metabolite transporter (DMT)-like permease